MIHFRYMTGVNVLMRSFLSGVLSLSLASTALATPNWPKAPYTYYADQEDLPTLLRDFAGGFSLSLQLGGGVNGKVNGNFNTSSPTEFLNRLGGVYGFTWFVYAGTLFVSRGSDIKTRTVSSMGSSISALREALERLGVLDARFGWGELPDQDIALVSGPPEYVDLVVRTVDALPLGPGGQEVAVFRLKHATVNDRTISWRDQTMVTPGLATVLRNLIMGDENSAAAGTETLRTMAAPLRQEPPVFPVGTDGSQRAEGSSGEGTDSKKTASSSSGKLRFREPTVQADTRLNAIIVQDVPDRIPIYKALIEQLDVPSTLIEIEAMIVDVNTDQINELGVTWGVVNGDTSIGYENLALAPNPGLPIDTAAGLAPGTLGVNVGTSLAARFHALQSEGKAAILSQPSVLTTDNMGALMDISDTFYVQTTGDHVATVTPISAGTSLRVTPRYIDNPEGPQVELTVDIEDGRIQTETPIGGLPLVRRSNISTLAVVGNDQTLLIGGHNSTQDSQRVEKIPFLGDIPLLGALFSNRSKTYEKRERLFLIRPRVIAINGKPVMQSWSRNGTALLDATWDDSHPMMGGDSLTLAAGQTNYRVRRATTQVNGGRPVRANHYLFNDRPF